MVSREFLYRLEDEVNRARQEINQEYHMSLKLQGIASKMALLQHNVEADAERLGAAIDAADAKRQAVMPKAVASVSAMAGQLADVETFVASVEHLTNGAPDEPVGPTLIPPNQMDHV